MREKIIENSFVSFFNFRYFWVNINLMQNSNNSEKKNFQSFKLSPGFFKYRKEKSKSPQTLQGSFYQKSTEISTKKFFPNKLKKDIQNNKRKSLNFRTLVEKQFQGLSSQINRNLNLTANSKIIKNELSYDILKQKLLKLNPNQKSIVSLSELTKRMRTKSYTTKNKTLYEKIAEKNKPKFDLIPKIKSEKKAGKKINYKIEKQRFNSKKIREILKVNQNTSNINKRIQPAKHKISTDISISSVRPKSILKTSRSNVSIPNGKFTAGMLSTIHKKRLRNFAFNLKEIEENNQNFRRGGKLNTSFRASLVRVEDRMDDQFRILRKIEQFKTSAINLYKESNFKQAKFVKSMGDILDADFPQVEKFRELIFDININIDRLSFPETINTQRIINFLNASKLEVRNKIK